MIIKSSQRAGHRQLAAHLIKSRDEDGEAQDVRISNYRNLMSAQSVHAALMDMEMMAWASPRTKKDLYHISMSPSQELTEDEWEKAWDIYETEFGLEDHPFIEVTHDKKGRVHQHRVYERVNTETERSIKLSFTKIRNELVARQLEYEFGHALTVGKHNRTVMIKLAEQGKEDIVAWLEQSNAHDVDRPVADTEFSDLQQEHRTSIKKADVKAALKDAYAKTDTGAGFEAAIAEQNLLLCRGDRRDFVVVDARGGTHSPRRMIGVKEAELRKSWADLDSNTLLTVQQAKASREAQWKANQAAEQKKPATAESAAASTAATSGEMTPAERLQEGQLLANIAALQWQLYEELHRESLGAETLAATYPFSSVSSATIQTENSSAMYQDFARWQEEHGLTDGNADKQGLGRPDQRQLIEQLQHWQTIAAADQERTPPQDGGIHGTGRDGSIDSGNKAQKNHAQQNATDTDQPLSQEYENGTADITSWGLSPSTLLLIKTFTGPQAIAERERRLDAALATENISDSSKKSSAVGRKDAAKHSSGVGNSTVHQKTDGMGSPASDLPSGKRGATAEYLQALGQHLREKGRDTYTQADRWLAERLAKRGYSRQETRRVIAHSSPELLAQAPGQRVGYIRRIVERVYRRREHWEKQLGRKGLAVKDKKKEIKQQNIKPASGRAAPRTVIVSEAPAHPIIKTTKPVPKPSAPSKQRRDQSKSRSISRDMEPDI